MGTLEEILKETIKPAVTFVFGKTLNEFLLLLTMVSIGYIGYYELTIGRPEIVKQIQEGHREARTDFKEDIKQVIDHQERQTQVMMELMGVPKAVQALVAPKNASAEKTKPSALGDAH